MAYRTVQFPALSEAEGHFCYNAHNSRNIMCKTTMCLHKLESTCGLWFKLYYHTWRTSQGHRQSLTLEKW